MKKLLVSVVILFMSISASAQAIKFSMGVKGVAVKNIMTTGTVQNGGGGGIFASIRIANVIGFQADALYNQTSHSFTNSFLNHTDSKVIHNYLLVPVVSQIWLGRSIAMEVGYQQAIVLFGKIDTGSDVLEDKSLFDYGSLLAGVNFNLGKVFTFSFRYAYGLDYSYIAMVEPSKNHTLQASLGIRLFSSKKRIFE